LLDYTGNNMLAPFNNIIITTAQPAILPQVKRFFREQGFRPQAPRGDEIHIALLDDRLIGALRLCPHDQAWLLRSMCIQQDFRQQGIGSFMLQQLQPQLARQPCYCFPYEHLQRFYQRAGFQQVSPEQAAIGIADKYRQYLDSGKKILLMQYQEQISATH